MDETLDIPVPMRKKQKSSKIRHIPGIQDFNLLTVPSMDDNTKVKKTKRNPSKNIKTKTIFCFSISDAEGKIVECNK